LENSNGVILKTMGERLNSFAVGDETKTKAELAELRHGIGLAPGEKPSLWGMLFENFPEEFYGKFGNPSKEEWAIYDALTLYALHQQGHDIKKENMNVKGVSLGIAAAKLVLAEGGTDDDRERVSKRFNQIALAVDVEMLTYYLRTFIPLLRTNGIGIDYIMLAQDIYWYQTENGRNSVKLKWGQDYYSLKTNNEEI